MLCLSHISDKTVKNMYTCLCPSGFVRADDDVDEDIGIVENDLGASREASRTGYYILIYFKNWLCVCVCVCVNVLYDRLWKKYCSKSEEIKIWQIETIQTIEYSKAYKSNFHIKNRIILYTILFVQFVH